MKCLVILSLVSLVAATPSPRADVTDIDILNYALTLEYLENAFYSGALAKYDTDAFNQAGLDRGRFEQISDHEAAHVAFLSTALGSQATKACNYSFPYTDLPSFVALSTILEGVGVSAYLGAAHLITNKDYLTAAGSILTTEARHAAWVGAVAGKGAPWNGAFDTPLTLDEVYSLAAPFITSCPSSNPTLPVKAFPALFITSGGNITAGSTITLSFTTNSTSTLYVAFLSGLTPTFVLYNNSTKSVTVPENLNGTVYAVVTKGNSTGAVTDDNTVAGPAILLLGGLSTPNTTQSTTTGSNSTGAGQVSASLPALVLAVVAVAGGLAVLL